MGHGLAQAACLELGGWETVVSGLHLAPILIMLIVHDRSLNSTSLYPDSIVTSALSYAGPECNPPY